MRSGASGFRQELSRGSRGRSLSILPPAGMTPALSEYALNCGSFQGFVIWTLAC